ncbi:MAG: cysteine desulfurase [Firmicutes bacterium]|nr:cysteine desulfurase [Bacillota bacterium]
MRNVYLDYAATTYTSHEVLDEMMPYFTTVFGNNSSIHKYGRDAEAAVAKARERIAKVIGAQANEIYFTSGATEANNWILKGFVEKSPYKRVIISQIEHASIMKTCEELKKQGVEIVKIPVNQDGVIAMSELLRAISRPAAVVSIMAANNEVGTVQYIQAIAKAVADKNIPFHTDAVQAFGTVSMNVKEMEISAMSLSSHKIYGPKGIGALYLKNGSKISKFIVGGGQERNMRSGTVAVPLCVGFGKAAEVAARDMSMNNNRIKALREYFIQQVVEKVEYVKLNGHRNQRLVNNANFSFVTIEGEALLTLLDFAGIAVSTGSACSSGTLSKSHVLDAMSAPDEINQSSIRFSLGRNTTKEDLDYVVDVLARSVKKLRSMSAIRVPKWFIKGESENV